VVVNFAFRLNAAIDEIVLQTLRVELFLEELKKRPTQ
jgi:hypothetical protein